MYQHFFNEIHFCRSVLGFKKIAPFAAGQKTIDKHYGKNKNFTKAVDEMGLVLGVARERFNKISESSIENPARNNNSQKALTPSLGVPAKEKNSPEILNVSTEIDKLLLKCRKLTVLIRKLTPEKIAAHCVIKKVTNSKRKKKKKFTA